MKKHTAFLLFTIGLLGFTSQAQIQLNNISVGASHWNRTYEGANETAFFTGAEEDADFTRGGIMPHLGAELNLYGGLALDGRIGLWTADFENNARFGDLVVEETIEQTIIPVSVGLLYRFNSLIGDDLNLFLGGGLNRYFIQNEVTRNVTGGTGVDTSDKFSGNNYGANAKAGLEYYFTPSLGLALEGRYNTGSYNQSFQPETGADFRKEEVSLQGLELGLSLRYRFSIPDSSESAEAED